MGNVAPSKLYKVSCSNSCTIERKKEALEYIYDKEIPVSDIKKIGSIDLGWYLFSKKTPIKGVFDKLLKGTPEAEATKILSC